MKWDLRMAAARRDIWKASDMRRLLAGHGMGISAGKMSALWSGQPTSIRLDDLEVICAVLGCGPEELLLREPGTVQARPPRLSPAPQRAAPPASSRSGDQAGQPRRDPPRGPAAQAPGRPERRADLQRLRAAPAGHRQPPAMLAVLANRQRRSPAVQGMRRPAVVLRLVHRLPPQDAPAAVGTAVVPVRLCLGSAARAVLLALLAVQPAVPGRDMRGLRPPGSDPPGTLPAVPLPGPVPGRALAVGHRPLALPRARARRPPAVLRQHGRGQLELRAQGPRPARSAGAAGTRRHDPAGVDPRQPELFTLPFEMTPWRILDGDWPRLSWYEHLLPAVARTGQLRGWSPSVQEHVRNTLRSLIATQPADARAYPASAVERLGAGPRHSTARTIELLTDLQLLAEDRPDPGDPWAAKRLAKLRDGIARDAGPWLDHLRHGDSRHRPKAPGTWRGYCTAIMPAPLAWAQDHDTLRE